MAVVSHKIWMSYDLHIEIKEIETEWYESDAINFWIEGAMYD